MWLASDMNKRRLWITIALGVSACVIAWLFRSLDDRNSNETRYQRLEHAARNAGWCRSAQKVLPSGLVKLLGLSSLEAHYMSRWEADRKALVDSAYLIEVPITVTNLAGHFVQVHSRIRKALTEKDAHWDMRFQVQSNLVIVTCRPQYEALCKEALEGK
jgi:hypothetical protein